MEDFGGHSAKPLPQILWAITFIICVDFPFLALTQILDWK